MENSFDLIRQLLTSMVATLPKLLGCLVILILGYIISKIVASVIKTVISKAGVDKLGKKIEEVDFIRKNNIEIKISGILSRIIFYFMMLIFIVAATDVLGMPALSDLFKNMLNYIPNVVVAGVLLLVGILVADGIRKAIETTGKSLGIPSTGMLATAFFYFIMINFLMAALGQLQIDTGFIEKNILIVIGGISLAFAIGYGLASKTIVSNILSAFYSKDKIKVGDEVTIDNIRGEILNIDRSSVTLLLPNHQKSIIPLSKVTAESITIHKEAPDEIESAEIKQLES
ncbi:MAG: mechanosensitive ion channel [Saprospiraceae bacterium]|jgi:small-conductance mechanosensitive channel|nr:mechanosensitive ion channel [Saprospiraceae bacterium]MBK7371711.1 mechanosensitive ion channel [Saprospiraceae bacterium]MBK9680678.1 mechanosensitive ion channel [Saprospiraceae bacterium]MBP7922008.1 mechanosensitive ion channel [Saprospiraceae bacterium]MBP9746731.1 mechanosensitive ion channel [Saprospiraceae bacterium]